MNNTIEILESIFDLTLQDASSNPLYNVFVGYERSVSSFDSQDKSPLYVIVDERINTITIESAIQEKYSYQELRDYRLRIESRLGEIHPEWIVHCGCSTPQCRIEWDYKNLNILNDVLQQALNDYSLSESDLLPDKDRIFVISEIHPCNFNRLTVLSYLCCMGSGGKAFDILKDYLEMEKYSNFGQILGRDIRIPLFREHLVEILSVLTGMDATMAYRLLDQLKYGRVVHWSSFLGENELHPIFTAWVEELAPTVFPGGPFTAMARRLSEELDITFP